jgi:glutathione reductase (NADPH)
MEKFQELGIDVHTRTTVESVHKSAAGFVVNASRDGNHLRTSAGLVIHAAGRRPDLDDLDLAAAGLALDQGRLKLNEFLQSVSNPRIYAAGDAAGRGPPLTPVAAHEGRTVAANLLEGNRYTPEYRGVPSVAFTIPAIAAVGLSEASARAKGLKFRVNAERTSDWYTARRLNERVYGFKTLIEEDTGHILGAHLVGPHAEDDINLFALAIRHALTAEDLKTTTFAYPTGASDISSML